MENYEMKVVDKTAALKALEKAKKEELRTPLFMRRLNDQTVVYSRQEDRLDEYEKRILKPY